MGTDAIVAIQDMGAAGLTSSSFEMASKGGLGLELDLDRVPQREEGMSAYEIMLSESQERMLMVLRPGGKETAAAVFGKWGLEFAVIGRLTDTGRMVLSQHGRRVADLPIRPLADGSPEYDRPWTATPPAPPAAISPDNRDPMAALRSILGGPAGASRRWIWEQYDHTVMGDTIGGPGGDAAVVRIHGTARGLALTSDCTPRYCLADPVEGGRQAVAEAWRNLTAVGARPLAVTDNLNFGDPERPEVMGQFVGCIRGMGEACRALDFPVVSGNVSLYNETNGRAVLPTPVVGAVGLLDDLAGRVGMALPGPDLALVLVGETRGHLGRSLWLETVAGREEGPPPPVDLAAERRNGDFARAEIQAGRVAACHDLSDGGLLVAAAEMALAGGVGATLRPPLADAVAGLFGEDQARYLLAVEDPDDMLERAAAAGVPALRIGGTGGGALTVEGHSPISLDELRDLHEAWMPAWIAGG